MKFALSFFKILILFTALGASAYVLYAPVTEYFTPPCSKPVVYTIGTYDPRFGISESQFKLALLQAASVWNTQAGRVLVTAATQEGEGIPVSLIYSEVQKATELGKNIDAEQAAYDAKKAEVNEIKNLFTNTKQTYEQKTAAYEAAAKAYQQEVARWNAKGGAPPEVYRQLKAQADALEADRRELNAEADAVNNVTSKVNAAVHTLNALAERINKKVNTYNKNAGEDFDQGNYVEDAEGKRITIYEFKNQEDLARVLTHEFGHALSLGHVENPDSIMYSFNIGEGMTLTEEDKAELRIVCKLD